MFAILPGHRRKTRPILTRPAGFDPLILGEPALAGYGKHGETGGDIATSLTGRNNGRCCGGDQLGQAFWDP